MDDEHLIMRRLRAVLEYDRIPKHRQVAYVAKLGKISRSTAYRLLNEEPLVAMKRFPGALIIGLGVNCDWLISGEFSRFDLRTMRIHLQTYKGYPKEDTDRIMRMLVGKIAGHRKAENLFNLAATGELSFSGAAGLL